MNRFPRAKRVLVTTGLAAIILGSCYRYAIIPHHSWSPPESAYGLLDRADALAWTNRWAEARPLYAKATELFLQRHEPSRALYAEVSEIPADESTSIPENILRLSDDLKRSEAQDSATRLRLLTIRGMLEINYDAGQALSTWKEVESLAMKQAQIRLATRAEGEQGIAAFILGDTQTAKKQVVKAWGLSQVEHDPAATIRYAGVFGQGLVQIHRYKEALIPLDKAISLAQSNPEVAYPTIAVYAKIGALLGLHRYDEALKLANASLERLNGTSFDGHRAQVYISRGSIEQEQGNLDAAVSDFREALAISQRIGTYRGVVDSGGLLAIAYEQQQKLPEADNAINAAIEANTRIPDELYLVPRNLAIKADIAGKMGLHQQADNLYRKGIALVNRMMEHAPTTNVQRQLLAEMSDVYSGYFASLCSQHRYNEALQILDNVRGRVEAEALQHHVSQTVHSQTPEERELTRLNISLINTDDPASRSAIASSIYTTELTMAPSLIAQKSISHPVSIVDLQKSLDSDAMLVEYVLAEPTSYALAITHNSVKHYQLASRQQIEADATLYRKELHSQKVDRQLAQKLFAELLKPIPDYGRKSELIVVPDGALHLLPFSALQDDSGYVLASHSIDVNPSATVYQLLHTRVDSREASPMPYVGVAAWTQPADTRNAVLRAVLGPRRSELVSLPESQKEVESIAQDLPRPSTILLGSDATETHFKQLPLEDTQVIHLALHGYADLDYPDRSALIFAPDSSGSDDGLLQIREIRKMHLKAKLVTLSACDTGVGPIGETGVMNLVNAFIEAGADSVVSTLWDIDDHTTVPLMQRFYSQLATHGRKIDALRFAQLELLNKGLPPYYWASFQIVGDGNGSL
jgi:CHAT domain-containing protein